MDRVAWLYALGWYFVIQFLSRLITPAEMNVNVSHSVDPGWRHIFSGYWAFWLVLTLGTAVLLWVLGRVLNRLWPETEPPG